ncbi:MAG: aminoglycoside 6-adenylyltransferase [Anaerolineae bacterium]|nr:aminoglycoside 6-adenylyltransferase [Anaerolineae bacterium]
MDQIILGYERLIERFVAWAQAEANIRAAVVIGSRARTDHPADEWADLDIIVFATDIERYIASADWVENVGVHWLTFVERTPGGGWERRVLFDGGLDVDFALNPAADLAHLATGAVPPDVADIIRRGVRVLVDKDGLLAQLSAVDLQAPPYQPPAESEFLNLVHDFWYHTVWTTKHLRRGEVWWAKSCCDMYLKERLRRMLEWHARAVNGPGHDTWMRGRFLEEWADPCAVAQLPEVFAHYDRQDIARALRATMALFRRLAVETARRWGYAYPAAGEQFATELVETLLAGMNEPPTG